MGKTVRGKRVLVTGSSAGLGRAIALELASRGANLVLWDLDSAGNAETARLAREFGVEAEYRTVNVADRDDFAAAAAAAGAIWGVVNNAGIVNNKAFLESSDDRNELSFKVNTFAHFWAAKHFLPAMIKADDGVFVS